MCRDLFTFKLTDILPQDNSMAGTCNISLEVARPTTVMLGSLPAQLEVDKAVKVEILVLAILRKVSMRLYTGPVSRGGRAAPGGDVSLRHGWGGGETAGASGGCQQRWIQIFRVYPKVRTIFM